METIWTVACACLGIAIGWAIGCIKRDRLRLAVFVVTTLALTALAFRVSVRHVDDGDRAVHVVFRLGR